MLFKKKIKLGVLGPEPKNIQDFQLVSVQAEVVQLPEEFDLRGQMTSIQRQIYGTCTANAVDGVKEFQDSKEYHKEIKLSQRFIYYNTKKISGLWNMEGDYVKNALKAVCDYGVCLEATFPDTADGNWENYVKKEPSLEAYKEAEKYKGKTYWAVGNSLEDFRQAIFQQKEPVIFSMPWNESYRKTDVDGRLSSPAGKDLGGHAISCAGWTKDKLWVRNSHDKSWGLNGYCYIPFSDFPKYNLWNAWILLDIVREDIIGWVAGKYIKRIGLEFNVGEKVTPISNLNLRQEPTTNSGKISLIEPGKECEILEGGIENNGYKWWKVKVKN